ncbi:PKD domain-containing protein [Ferruginibacter sp.]|nr:PKD domain-containing protein [Ferruginibacter sp.]
MRKLLLILLTAFVLFFTCEAQQANFWYFGDKAGLNFNTTPPTALTNSQMSTTEGCSTVSDSTGNLLFYTDGVTVWNKNHQPMPNGTGLMGHESSTHSSIVIPKPGSATIYYIFTADADEHLYAYGYRYSEVDMSLNGGLGNITAVKNILLYAPCTEKLTAASHANGIDIWVITKELGNHTYRSYKVTCNGVDNNPVLSTVASISGNTLGYRSGCIKVSPDGTKIASARGYEGKWDLLKFDNNTGVISDRILIPQPGAITIYGAEFSPNSQLVYINGTYTYQYKVAIHDSTTIINSRYQVDSVAFLHPAIQLGPDNKLYSNTFPKTSVINNPNQYGSGCGYTEQAISLSGRNGKYGLPTFFSRLVTNYNVDYTYSFQPDCRTIDFTGSSNVPGPVTWTWDFGDGNTGTGQNISHVFPTTPNQFTVTLTINNANVCGGTSTRTKLIVFNRIAPTAKFGFTTSCNNLSVAFHDSSAIGTGAQIVSYLWNFGDGNTSNAQHPIHTYTVFGTYPVMLTVVSNDQCNSTDTITKIVNVAAKPAASFTVTNTCYTNPFSFTNNSTLAAGAITNWYWNFGDGNTSALQIPVHTYSSFGTYTVKLVATSEFNCISDTFSLPVVAGAKPQVNFTLPAVCLLDAYANFTNNTTVADTSTLSYLWNFGDPNATTPNPNTSILQNPTHQYSVAAVYNVKLVTTTYLGCKDSVTKSFTVNGAVPKANFIVSNASTLCSNTDVTIKDSSYVDFGNITLLKIYWGDGDSTIDNNPGQVPNGNLYNHRYTNFSTPAFKTFTIQMHSYSGGVCVDIRSKIITVNASPEILFNAIPEVCNESLPFNITQASEVWGLAGNGFYSGTGITNGPAGTFNPALVSAGSYLITYSYISNFGCRADSTKLITVNPTPQAAFSFTHGCLPDASIQFTSAATLPGGNGNALQHVWNFGDPLAGTGNPNTSNAINPSHIYHSQDSFAVSLQTISAKGCMHDTIIKLYQNIDIFPQPIARFKIDSLKPICAGSPVYFINQSNGSGQPITQYQWNFGDGNSSVAQSPNHTYSTYGKYAVSLWLQNDKGCRSATLTDTAIVHSTPVANFSYDSACFGKPVQFTDISTNSLGTVSAWNWNMGNGNITALQNPVTTYLSYLPFTVTLKVATQNGCTSAIVAKTISIQKVNVSAGRDTSIAKNQPLQLQATGASNYTWTPATGLNNNAIANPIAILNNSYQTYYLKGVTTEGCQGFDTINIKVFTRADIYVPNAFTPNADGVNDYLQPICIGIKQLNYFTLFDRWGNIVFTTKNFFDKWDATLGGKKVPNGNFVWIAEAVTYDGQLIQRKGSVMVIR